MEYSLERLWLEVGKRSRAAVPSFSDLSAKAACLRTLSNTRETNEQKHSSPDDCERTVELAYQYQELVDTDEQTLGALPIERSPEAYRAALHGLEERADWAGLVAPDSRRVRLEGVNCHGLVHKILCNGDNPPKPSIVSTESPPEIGVWQPDAVRAVAAAKALAHERDRTVPWAIVEYPAAGVVRDVRLTARRKVTYRRVLRAIQSTETATGKPDKGESGESDRQSVSRPQGE